MFTSQEWFEKTDENREQNRKVLNEVSTIINLQLLFSNISIHLQSRKQISKVKTTN